MNLKSKIACYFFLSLAITAFTDKAFAQLRQLAVDRSEYNKQAWDKNTRLLADTLELPFWDDFSTAKLDSSKWVNEGAVLSQGVAINAPTIGVMVLDGTKSNGQPYSTDISQQGVSDQLTSQMINLANITDEQQNSVYFSFFWQAGGNAELPDENDRLELLFLDSLGNWNQVWSRFGGETPQEFQQEILQVDGVYLHDHFQFKFQNSGRLAGPFDSWLIDYVFLNRQRSGSDLFYSDRALTQLNSNLLGKYSALPFYEFNASPLSYLTSVQNQFKNLNDRFRAMEFSVQVRDKVNQETVLTLNSNTPFNPVPLANERRYFNSIQPSDWSLDDFGGPLDLESVVYLSSGDTYLINEITANDTTYHQEVDFRVNDTIRTIIPLRDYYAYDRGTVDYAAGINQRSGMIAVKYSSSTSAYINAISINFTNASQRGTAVDLMIWNSLDEAPIFTKEVIIQDKNSINEFTKYSLDTTIRVNGIFYVGFQQYTNEFVHIGLDKSNDTSEEVFYNTAGSWQPNTEVKGSLMIRPHLQTMIDEPIEGNTAESIIRVYPNPTFENRVYVEGEIDLVKMYDAFGREINIHTVSSEKGKIINFTKSQKGVYLIRVWSNNTPRSIRILVE